MKTCTKCNIEKTSDDFYKHKRTCKDCCKQNSKSWRSENKDIVKETSRKSYLKHKEARKEPRRKYAADKRKTDVMFALRSRIGSMIRKNIDKQGSNSVDMVFL